MEPVERIYCCDRDNNDNALAAAILAKMVIIVEMIGARWPL